MRMDRVTPGKLKYFRNLCKPELFAGAMEGKLLACGAVMGTTPCALLLAEVEEGIARVVSIEVAEAFRRRHLACDLLSALPKLIPGIYRIELSYWESEKDGFLSYLETREGNYREEESYSFRLILNQETLQELMLPGGDRSLCPLNKLSERQRRKLLPEEERDWYMPACICHESGGLADAWVLVCREADGGLRLYEAGSTEEGGLALLACIRWLAEAIRTGEIPELTILCRTKKQRQLFTQLFPGQGTEENRKTIYWYPRG